MKKIIIIIFAAFFCLTAKGQTYDIHGIPTHSLELSVADGTGEAFIGIFVEAITAVTKALFDQESESKLVGLTPYISTSYTYHFPGTRFSVGPEVGYWHMGIMDVTNATTYHLHTTTLAASGKVFYKPDGVCKLYGNVCAGAGVFISQSEASLFPAIQLNPIGMRLGNESVAFVAELGAGYKGILQLGINVGL